MLSRYYPHNFDNQYKPKVHMPQNMLHYLYSLILLTASFMPVSCLFFDPEDGSDLFLLNTGSL
jgi:hypothetical protein